MDLKKIVEFDKHIKWISDHKSNPYAMVLDVENIWYFSEKDNPKDYNFFKLLIQDNAKPFKWGLSKQKTIMIFEHSGFNYFMAPPDIVYKVQLKIKKKKKR